MRKTCWGSPLHAPWEAQRLCRLHMLPSSPADQKYPHTYQQRGAGIADWSIFVFTKLHHVLSVTQPGSAWEGPLEAAGAVCCRQNQQRWPEGLSSQVLWSSGDGGSPSPWLTETSPRVLAVRSVPHREQRAAVQLSGMDGMGGTGAQAQEPQYCPKRTGEKGSRARAARWHYRDRQKETVSLGMEKVVETGPWLEPSPWRWIPPVCRFSSATNRIAPNYLNWSPVLLPVATY